MRLHDMTPKETSFPASHLAKEATGYNVMSEIVNFFSEFAELRSSSTSSSFSSTTTSWKKILHGPMRLHSDHCPRQTKGNIYGGIRPGS
jgi:hypothetical protein